LTRDIDSSLPKRALTASMVGFAREMDSQLIAEGVETQAEMDTLVDLGVDLVQGFYLYRPSPLEAVSALRFH